MKKGYKTLIILLLLAGCFFLTNRFLGDTLKNTFYKISAPLQKAVWKAGDKISDGLTLPFRLKNIQLENERLIKQNLSLKQENLNLKALQEENNNLKAALQIAAEQKLELSLADVTAKDPEGNFLVIAKGKKDGLSEGLAVITADGALVGRIEKTFDDFSQVLLITAKKSSFDIEIQDEKSTLAVAKGGEGQSLFFELAPQDAVIQNGNLVKTTTLGGKFPKNIIVGEVIEFQKAASGSFQEGQILPYFLKNNPNQLFVITNY